MSKRVIDFALVLLLAASALIAFYYFDGWLRWLCTILGFVCAVPCFYSACTPTKPFSVKNPNHSKATITELALLGDEGNILATWPMYGQTGMVIGRDVGENHVTVNLDQSVYASMIDVEHAVLNYSDAHWYIEDLGSRNGVWIEKQMRKYRLASDKPCQLESGDYIYIATAKLMVR